MNIYEVDMSWVGDFHWSVSIYVSTVSEALASLICSLLDSIWAALRANATNIQLIWVPDYQAPVMV